MKKVFVLFVLIVLAAQAGYTKQVSEQLKPIECLIKDEPWEYSPKDDEFNDQYDLSLTGETNNDTLYYCVDFSFLFDSNTNSSVPYCFFFIIGDFSYEIDPNQADEYHAEVKYKLNDNVEKFILPNVVDSNNSTFESFLIVKEPFLVYRCSLFNLDDDYTSLPATEFYIAQLYDGDIGDLPVIINLYKGKSLERVYHFMLPTKALMSAIKNASLNYQNTASPFDF